METRRSFFIVLMSSLAIQTGGNIFVIVREFLYFTIEIFLFQNEIVLLENGDKSMVDENVLNLNKSSTTLKENN